MLNFQEAIITWYDTNKRDLPWRSTKNPYFIWLSEVILQQTRVEQGKPYYFRFLQEFPSVQALAQASEEEVLNVWKGLGYYSRARKMHAAAKMIVSEGKGFPNTYERLLALPGIGPYTAAAIASIAFDEPKAALDGNVFRIVTRLFNLDQPIDSAQTLKTIQALAQEGLSLSRPGDFNQALMDLGALICSPRQPKCESCPLSFGCQARALNTYHERPVKTPKKKQKQRYVVFHLHVYKGKIALVKQTETNIWKNLYLLPLEEFDSEETFLERLAHGVDQKEWLLPRGTHVLSHQKWHYATSVLDCPPTKQEVVWCDQEEVMDWPIPVIIEKVLRHFKGVPAKAI